MEATSRFTATSVTKKLRHAPTEFDFFQAVRLLEQVSEQKPRVGCSVKPVDDIVQFGQTATLGFEPSTISAFSIDARRAMPTLFVYFFGLLGPNGPMPLHLTQFIRDRERNNGDATQSRFLDMFHHRMLSFFYRSWSLSEQAVSYDRRDDDWFSWAISCLGGYGDRSFHNRDHIPDTGKRYWTGRLIGPSGCTEGLAALLSGFFEVPVNVHSFTGFWAKIPNEYLCRLNGEPGTSTVGGTAILGATYFERMQRFTVQLGPLGIEDFNRLRPGKAGYVRIFDWIRNYLTTPLTWNTEYILAAEDVPQTQLGSYGELGVCTWLKSKEFSHDSNALKVSSDSKYFRQAIGGKQQNQSNLQHKTNKVKI